jgi:chitodextrinase
MPLDLLIGSNWVTTGTSGAGTNYTQREISGWDGDILEDRIVSSAGAYNATAPLSSSGSWIMQLAAFKAAGGGGGDTQPPTAPSGLTINGTPTSSQIALSWTASTDNVGVTGYLVERCQGSSCSNFSQIATPAGTSFTDTGLSASTTYKYRVRATDAAGNTSGYSNTLSGTTAAGSGDTQPPSAPANLAVLASSGSEVDLTWGASTDNVGVTLYLIERCSGAGCGNFAQIGTSTTPPYYDTTAVAGTAYSYRVRATDAASNLSSYSNVLSMSTPVSSPDCN